jgi:FkbM family methyltransferase
MKPIIKKLLLPILDTRFGKRITYQVNLERFLRKRQLMKIELSRVPVVESGSEKINGQDVPYVMLENNTVLYGRLSTDLEREVYQRWKKDIKPGIREETIQVAMDVVLRYLYPHAMPHLTMPYPRSQRACFHKQHIETIMDLPDIKDEEKQNLVEKFLVKKGESFLDIGAYMGYGTVRMARELDVGSRILAVEADPDSVWLLEQNVKANNLSNVSIIHKAVSNSDGTASFYKTGRQANSLISEVVSSEHEIQIPTTAIDSILKGAGMDSVDRISITINGAEVEAVQGMEATVKQSRNIRISLAGWYKRDGRRIADIVSPLLKEYGLHVAIGREGGVLAWK